MHPQDLWIAARGTRHPPARGHADSAA